MTIRVLKDIDSSPVIVSLDDGTMVIAADYDEIKRFFVITDLSLKDLGKLKAFGIPSSYKVVGFKKDFNILKESFYKEAHLERFVEISASTEVIFYPQSQKIRVERNLGESVDTPTSSSVKNYKVLVVDDSKTIQKLLCRIIGLSTTLEVVGVANNAEEAKKFILRDKPDLITLDIHMPGENGVEFLKNFLKAQSIPTVMISSVSMNEGPLVLEALANGAQTYIQKPSIEKVSELAPNILEKLESIASLRKNKGLSGSSAPIKALSSFQHLEGLIAIGSSTGGTQALQDIITNLPSEIPPVVIVQHIPAVFSKAFAQRLDALCPFKVKEAVDGEFLKPNHIYIAPGGKQMKLLKRGSEIRVETNDDEPLNRFKPSVDYLFNSIPSLGVEILVGIILTGMGRDGAKGLLGLKESGAITLTQCEESSVVYGMPKAAFEIGASQRVVSLNDMAVEIVTEFNKVILSKSA